MKRYNSKLGHTKDVQRWTTFICLGHVVAIRSSSRLRSLNVESSQLCNFVVPTSTQKWFNRGGTNFDNAAKMERNSEILDPRRGISQLRRPDMPDDAHTRNKACQLHGISISDCSAQLLQFLEYPNSEFRPVMVRHRQLSTATILVPTTRYWE